MIKSYPEIFTLGAGPIKDIFDGEIEITEKVDGSFISFGIVDGVLYIRSKSSLLFDESIGTLSKNSMFDSGINYIKSIKSILPNDVVFYGEYFLRPKHNVLKYNRVPKNNIILFGCALHPQMDFIDMYTFDMGLEYVPVLEEGKFTPTQAFYDNLTSKESILGGGIEGIVIKNYKKVVTYKDKCIAPIMIGKYVLDKFKEVHKVDWKQGENRFEKYFDSFKTTARWEKAVQHLKEKGELINDPKDIGLLIKEVQADVFKEEEDDIKQFLFNGYKNQISKAIIRGLPEWYKEKLLQNLN